MNYQLYLSNRILEHVNMLSGKMYLLELVWDESWIMPSWDLMSDAYTTLVPVLHDMGCVCDSLPWENVAYPDIYTSKNHSMQQYPKGL